MAKKLSSFLILKSVLDQRGNSIGSLEVLANDALSAGLINHQMYGLLQTQFYFQPSRINSTQTRDSLQNMPEYTFKAVMNKSFRILADYALKPEAETLYDVEIDLLPWDMDRSSVLAINGLKKSFRKMPTVEEVVAKFEGMRENSFHRTPQYYGRRALEATYNTFRKVGIELPKITFR